VKAPPIATGRLPLLRLFSTLLPFHQLIMGLLTPIENPEYTSAMPYGGLKSVVLWVLPNYAAILVLVILYLSEILPFRTPHTLEGWWILIALLLPISALVAAVKAVQLSLRAEGVRYVFWHSVVAWCLVAPAVAFNVFSYMVISHGLR